MSEDGRIEFVGNLASEALRRRYKDRLVTDLFHGQNPIKYVGGACSLERVEVLLDALCHKLASLCEELVIV